MSGLFYGDAIPYGVAADAFFQKGRGIAELLKMMKSLPRPNRLAQEHDAAPSPVWIARHQRNDAGEGYATIECPECLGTFPQALDGEIHPVSEADCIYCGGLVRYATVPAKNLVFLLPIQQTLLCNAALHRFKRLALRGPSLESKGMKHAEAQTSRA